MQYLIEEYRDRLSAICRTHHVRRRAIFGSVRRDDFDPVHSDMDFIVEFEPLVDGTYADTYFSLISALEQLLKRRIDLVEAGAVRNPYFQREIELHQELVYAAKPAGLPVGH